MNKKPLSIDRDKGLILVDKDYCDKHIKVLTLVNRLKLKFNDKIDCYYFYKEDLCDIFFDLREKFALRPGDSIDREAREKVIQEFSGKLPYYDEINEVLSECEKYKKFNSIRKLVDYIFDSEETIMEAFEVLSRYVKLYRDFYCLVDLIIAKQDIVKSLSYIVSAEELDNYEKQYSDAIDKLNVNRLKELLESAQEKILEHWQTFLTNPNDYIKGGPFRFLCHSVSHIFSGKFKSNIVSMSLLTDKLFDCFADEYGFILPPTNIIGADSKDMYVNNSAEVDCDVLSYTTINKIFAPERLVEECFDKKQRYKQEEIYDPVYSEVAKRVFDPIGIFYLTDGSKNIDDKYQNVNKLSENFPNLKVVEIDKTLYIKDRIDFFNVIVDLVLEIRRYELYSNNFSYSYSDIKRLSLIGAYDRFFEDFMELKKKPDYTENDIVSLYENYEKLLFAEISLDELFLKFQPKEIDIVLKYNINCGINNILFGKKEQDFTNVPLNFRFDELAKVYLKFMKFVDVDKLNDYVPGLADFLILFPKVTSFDKATKLQICACSNFLDINKIIINHMNKNELESLELKGSMAFYLPKGKLADEEDIRRALPEMNSLDQIIKEKTEIMLDYINAITMLSYCNKYHSIKNKIHQIESSINSTMETLKRKQQALRDYENSRVRLMSKLKNLDESSLDVRKKIKEIKDNLFVNKENIEYCSYNIECLDEQLEQKKQKLQKLYDEFIKISGYDLKSYQDSLATNKAKKDNISINQEFVDKLIAEIRLNEILDSLGLTYGMLVEYQKSYHTEEDSHDSILKKVML